MGYWKWWLTTCRLSFLTGGGHRFSGLVTPTDLESRPKAPNAEGWTIRIDNHSGFPATFEVTAFCGTTITKDGKPVLRGVGSAVWSTDSAGNLAS